MPDDTDNQAKPNMTPVCLASVDDLVRELARRANADLGVIPNSESGFGDNDAKPVHVEKTRDIKPEEKDARGVLIVVMVSPKMPPKPGIVDEENRQVMVCMAGDTRQVLLSLQYAADRYVAGIMNTQDGDDHAG